MIPYNVTSRISLTPRVCRNKMDADIFSCGVFFQLMWATKNRRCLGKIGDYTTQLCMHYQKTLPMIPVNNQYFVEGLFFFRSSCVIPSGYIVSHRYRLAFWGHGGKWFLQASFAGQTWKAGLSIWRECSKPWLVVCYRGCDEILPNYIYTYIYIYMGLIWALYKVNIVCIPITQPGFNGMSAKGLERCSHDGKAKKHHTCEG